MLLTALIIIIFLSVLILVHELGHFLMAKKFKIFVEEFGMGLPPKIFGKKYGETTYSINALPIGGFVKIAGENREEEIHTKEMERIPENRIFYNLKIWKRFLIIAAGVTMNFILGWILISIIFMVGIPKAVVVSQVQPNTPASEAGLQPNDIISGFNSAEEVVNFINQNKGKEISLTIEKDGKEVKFKAIPRLNPPQGEGSLGIALVDAGQDKEGFFRAFYEGLKASWRIFTMIFAGIFNLIKTAILGEASLNDVTGPVGIVKITAQASHMGIIYLMQLLALISINLAALNIFPFPALDGGRLLFLIIEKIKGSPLPKKFEQYANTAGMILLLLLMAIITAKDIWKLF